MTERHAWVPYVTVAAGALLLLHAVLIFATADTASDSITVSLYLGGLLLALVAAVGTGLRQRKGRRLLVGVACAFGLVAWAMAVGDFLTPVFEAVKDEAWAGDAGPIGVLGVVLLALGARARTAVGRTPANVGTAT